jgi:hypothetical protein
MYWKQNKDFAYSIMAETEITTDMNFVSFYQADRRLHHFAVKTTAYVALI